MRHCDERCPRAQTPLELLQHQLAVIVDWSNHEPRANLLAKQLPRHDVGVMLEGRNQDLVAGLQMRSSIGARHEIDRLGGSAHEHDLAFGPGIDETLHGFPRIFIRPGGALAQFVHATMNVRAIKSDKNAFTASMTACGFCVVAALSR